MGLTVATLRTELPAEPLGSDSDQQLLERFVVERDESAFTRLVERHGRTIWCVCRRVLMNEHDAEDAFQAVFIVFARKAAVIRKGQAVGSWLYSVAYRIALRARSNAARRKDAEQKPAARDDRSEPWGEAALREMQRLLDEEVERLDEKYREPFVLCCLEGMSKSEAAAELGWKEGTVSGRLAQARKLLQSRLARRGVTLTAALTAFALAQNVATAAPPVLTIAAGGAASGSALALAEGFLGTIGASKLKAAIVAFLVMTMSVTAASVTAFQFVPGGPEQPPKVVEPIVLNDLTIFQPPPTPLMPVIDEQVLALAFSADGKRLVTAGARHTQPGQFMIWDVDTKKELVRVRGMRGIRGVAFSPDGKTVACGTFGGAISLRDGETGAERHSLANNANVNSVAYSADGNWLVSAGLDKVCKLWDMKSNTEKKKFIGHTDMVFSVAFFKHGKAFVSGSQDMTAKIWDIEAGTVTELLGHKSAVEAVAVSPDDALVATGSWDQTIKLWDAKTGKEEAVLAGQEGSILAIAFSHDGALLASATSNGTMRIWDVKTRTTIKKLERHAAQIWAIAFARDSKILASGSTDKTAKLWDVDAGAEIATLETGQLHPVFSLAQTPDGSLIASAGADKTVHVRDAKTGDLRFVLRGHTEVVTRVAIAPDGKTLVSGSRDGTIKAWDLIDGKLKHTLEGHTGGVVELAFAKNGQLASGSEDKSIKLWDIANGKELKSLNGHTDTVNALAFRADGTLASGGADHSIRIWDVSKVEAPRVLEGHKNTVRALAFAPDGTLASGSDDKTVKLWDVAGGKARITWFAHQGRVTALAFSPGGGTLVSGDTDNNIIIWDPAAGKQQKTLRGHKVAVSSLLISPDGEYLLSGGLDTAILRWSSKAAPPPARTLKGPDAGVWFAQYSPANDRLATGGAGGEVTLWARGLAPALAPYATKGGVCWDATFSADGRTVAQARDNKIELIDVVTGQVTRTIDMTKPVRSVTFSADRKYFAATTGHWKKVEGVTYEAKLWDAQSGKELATLDGQGGTVQKAVFSPDGKVVATSAGDATINVWELPSGKLRGVLRGHGAGAKGIVFLPNGTLVTASWDKTIRFWDVSKLEETKMWRIGMMTATLAASPDGALVAFAENPADNKTPTSVQVWEVATGKEKLELKGHSSRILGVSFTNDGRGLLAAGGAWGDLHEISYWDLATGQLRGNHKTPKKWWAESVAVNIDDRRVATASVSGMAFYDLDFVFNERTWNAHNNIVSCGTFANGGATLITSGWDRTIKVWNTRTGELTATMKGHTNTIRALVMLRDGTTLASGSEDSTVKLWDLATAKEKATLQGHRKLVYSLAVSPDGKTLASGGGDHKVLAPAELILWDIDTLKERKKLPGLERAVWAIDYSPDGQRMVASCAQGYVRVFSTDNDAVLANLPITNVRPLSFSADGKMLAVGEGKAGSKLEAGYGTIRFFETQSWKERTSLPGHQHLLFALAFSPDGQGLASASQDGTIKLHGVPTVTGGVRVIPPAKSAPNPLVEVAAKNETADAPADSLGSYGWLIAAAIGVMMMFVLVLLVAARIIMSRRGGSAKSEKPPPAKKQIEPSPASALITFACSACGKKLKVKSESAGKNVKCPGCAKLVVVPSLRVKA